MKKSDITAIALTEIKITVSFRFLAGFIHFLLVVTGSTWINVGDVERVETGSMEFQEAENTFFKTIPDYTFYSVFGFTIMPVPDPAISLHSSAAIMMGITGEINSIIKLEMKIDAKGLGLGNRNSIFQFLFAPLIQWLGGLLVLVLAYELVRWTGYLKSLSSRRSLGRVYTTLIATRVPMVLLAFLAAYGCVILTALAKGVAMSPGYFTVMPYYVAAAIVMLLFFFSLGTLTGSIFTGKAAHFIIVILWILLVFMIPHWEKGPVSKASEDLLSPSKLKTEKMKIMTGFEKSSEEEYGKLNIKNIEAERKIVEGFFNNEFVQMQQLEKDNRTKLAAIIESYHDLSMLLPTTYYIVVSEETGSRGYGNYLAFYDYLIKLRYLFTRFWIDMVYYGDPAAAVKNFVQNSENLFPLKPRHPPNFTAAMLIGLGLSLLLIIIAYLLIRR
ncbi:MAG: hypothetical protein GY940_10265 [bacterium]|nr:hypothetical protein [bacterium]